MTAAATTAMTATAMATTITGRLESLRQMSHNPRLCSGVTIHERSNRGRRLRQRRDNDGRTKSSSIIISFFRSAGRESDNRGERVLALTEVLYSLFLVHTERPMYVVKTSSYHRSKKSVKSKDQPCSNPQMPVYTRVVHKFNYVLQLTTCAASEDDVSHR